MNEEKQMENLKKMPAEIPDIEVLDAPVSKESLANPAFMDAFLVLVDTVDYLTRVKSNVISQVKEMMRKEYEASGETKMAAGPYHFVYVPEHGTTRFDTAAFKKAHPDLANEFTKMGITSDSVRFVTPKEE